MDKALQTQLPNIETRTGKSLAALAKMDAELLGWIRRAYDAAA